ncbi:MAG: DUF4956 domain-containing protein [Hyphomonadaceae bacterium]
MSVAAPEPVAPKPTPAPAGAPLARLLKPYAYIGAYYAAIAAVIMLALIAWPGIVRFLPVGGAAEFNAALSGNEFESVAVNVPAGVETLAEGVKLTLAIVASFLLMLPVTWICMGARRRKDVSQSFIHTILILPIVITGIVHVVHNSLALAFSLAGIVAGVRFRHTLKDSADTTYLFTAIAVGVACGINAVEVAAIVSIFFNYTVLGLWATGFGESNTGRAMFSREWMAKEDEREKKEKRRDREERERANDDDDD